MKLEVKGHGSDGRDPLGVSEDTTKVIRRFMRFLAKHHEQEDVMIREIPNHADLQVHPISPTYLEMKLPNGRRVYLNSEREKLTLTQAGKLRFTYSKVQLYRGKLQGEDMLKHPEWDAAINAFAAAAVEWKRGQLNPFGVLRFLH